ncbi:MAG: PH domain-containing protein [Thermomicrobiales bacterium]
MHTKDDETMFCPDCGTKNEASARFCSSCGRTMDDVAETQSAVDPAQVGDQKDSAGRLIANDGLPVGEDLDGIPGGERILWQGRPSKLWSPRMALLNRYKVTNQRLMVEYGFIGRRTEEVDLYRVNDVGVKQNPLERILGFGDVFIAMNDASVSTKFLHNVTEPDRVKDLVRDASRQERQRRRVLLREDV